MKLLLAAAFLFSGCDLMSSRPPLSEESAPPGCDAAKFKVFSAMNANYEKAKLRFEGFRERPAVAVGQAPADDPSEIIGFSMNSLKLIFVRAEGKTFEFFASDGIDSCYSGRRLGEYAFTPEQIGQLDAALADIRRVETNATLPACPFSPGGYGSGGVIVIYFRDGTYTYYRSLSEGACIAPEQAADIPSIGPAFNDAEFIIRVRASSQIKSGLLE